MSREGAVISALFVGIIIGLFNRLLPNFEKVVPLEGHKTLTAATLEAPGKPVKELAAEARAKRSETE